MKNHFLTAVLLTAFLVLSGISGAYAQEQTNQARIAEAKKEMEEAAKKQDYATAANLQKEIELREKIEEAVAAADYAEAQRLKEELEGKPAAALKVTQSTEVKGASEDSFSSGEPFKSPVYDTPGFHPPTPGKAVVYFARVTKFGLAISFDFFHNDQFIGDFKGSNYMRHEVNPGKHLFWASSENKEYVTADLKAGETYIIIVDVIMGAWKARVGMNPLGPDDEVLERAVKLINKKPPKNTSEKDIEKTQNKLEDRNFIAEQLENYENRKDSKPYPHISPDMAIPAEKLK
ncbi:MAG: hypothetical protein ACNS60_09400 [Candidatus Cyclobacteriaceae bacterium M2_1C_046]